MARMRLATLMLMMAISVLGCESSGAPNDAGTSSIDGGDVQECALPEATRISICGRVVSAATGEAPPGSDLGGASVAAYDLLEYSGQPENATVLATAPVDADASFQMEDVPRPFSGLVGIVFRAEPANDGYVDVAVRLETEAGQALSGAVAFALSKEHDRLWTDGALGVGAAPTLSERGAGLAVFQDCDGQPVAGVTVEGEAEVYYFEDDDPRERLAPRPGTATGSNGSALVLAPFQLRAESSNGACEWVGFSSGPENVVLVQILSPSTGSRGRCPGCP